jgi:peptidoglycan/xylan/chitin deacetylase (PgdA/CDA1 family)
MRRPIERLKVMGTWAALWLVLLTLGCAVERPLVTTPDYWIVRPQPGETYANLAARYLGDPARGDSLRALNEQDHPDDAPVIVVPRRPFFTGGIRSGGYQTVPVLAFPPVGGVAGEAGRMPPEALRRHLEYLQKNGYAVVALRRLLSFIQLEEALPPRAVVLTFDDTSPEFYRHAFPHLVALGVPATLFVAADRVGGDNALNWQQLREMSAYGLEVQSRGRSEGGLAAQRPGEPFEAYVHRLLGELQGARRLLEERLGRGPEVLAYPQESIPSLTSALAVQMGYRAILVTAQGSNPIFADPFRLVRQSVPADAPPQALERLLTVFVREAAP